MPSPRDVLSGIAVARHERRPPQRGKSGSSVCEPEASSACLGLRRSDLEVAGDPLTQRCSSYCLLVVAEAESLSRSGGLHRWIVALTIAVLTGVVLIGAAVLVLAHVFFGTFTGQPTEHHNPSFAYGEKLMENYGAFNYTPSSDSSVEAVCRAAVRLARARPASLNEDEAVRGCLYTEFYLDN